jgi:effector-binding domain-containing protein
MTVLHPVNEAASPADRDHGEPELHRLSMRETAVVRVEVTIEELPGAIGSAVAEIEAAMAEAGVGLAGPPFTRYLTFDQPLRVEIGFPVKRPAPHVGRVDPGTLPGGRIASIVHIGPYELLAETYGVLRHWLDGLGLHATGPLWEVYWSDPETQPDPATWRTEIFVPVE